jgi:hypothetical protein
LITGQQDVEKRKRVRTPDWVNAVLMFAVSPNSQPQTSATPREISLLLGNISESSVRRVLKDDFGLKPIRRINAHHLTAAQKANRVVRCRE